MLRKLFVILVFFGGFAEASAQPAFRFHLLTEPHTLDPQAFLSSSGNYLIQSLYRGLMKFDDKTGLQPDGARFCKIRGKFAECVLSPYHLWSDGAPVKAQDYVFAFRRLIDPNNKSPQAELLFSLKNAKKIWLGKLSPEHLGVTAVNDKTLRFSLREPDSDFLLKLVQSALVPLRRGHFPDKKNAPSLLVTGPYRIQAWRPGDRIVLAPNPYYAGALKRPPVEALFIEDDSTALRLYEKGILSLLRRLPTDQIPIYRNRRDFRQFPIARFDYLGFSKALRPYAKLRRALSESLDFENFRTLFFALGRPGCPSLPPSLYFGSPCLEYRKTDAVKLFGEQGWPSSVPKQLGFSKMGGDDIERSAEWFQGQWRRNLGLLLELQSQEQAVYLHRLAVDPPAVFRKGIGLARPSCLAALENFVQGSPENFIDFKSTAFDANVKKLQRETHPNKARALCTKAIRLLIDENAMIPLGEIHFTMLARPEFSGWTINSLNQLDLSRLTYVKVP